MTTLDRRLTLLEAVVPRVDQEPTDAEQRWHEAIETAGAILLANTPERYAARIAAELTATADWAAWSPLTRHAMRLARGAAPSGPELVCGFDLPCGCGWHYGHNGPLSLPEALCTLLLGPEGEAVEFSWFDCQWCGYACGERDLATWRRERALYRFTAPNEGRGFFGACPIADCGGPVGHRAFSVAHHYSQQVAYQARADRFGYDWLQKYGLPDPDAM